MKTTWRNLITGILLLAGAACQSQPVGTERQPYLAARLYDELFDTTLPGQYLKGEWDLSLQPKMSDFVHDDYVRFLTGVRYSFSNYFDAYASLGSYFMNPAGDGNGMGLYETHLGARYTWFNYPGTHNNLAIGINAKIPISNPPLELTDGYARYRPFITISHQMNSRSRWIMYLNSMFEIVDKAPTRTHPDAPHPRDRLFLRPGIIFYPGGRLRYSFELEYRTNALHFRNEHPVPGDYTGPPDGSLRPQNWILAYEDVHEVIAKPGLTWFPAKQVRDGLWIPGEWDLGINLEIPLVEETGEDFGISVRFRWFYDYRKFLREDLPGVFGRE